MAARPIRMPSPGFLSEDKPGEVCLLGRPGADLAGGRGGVGEHLSLRWEVVEVVAREEVPEEAVEGQEEGSEEEEEAEDEAEEEAPGGEAEGLQPALSCRGLHHQLVLSCRHTGTVPGQASPLNSLQS